MARQIGPLVGFIAAAIAAQPDDRVAPTYGGATPERPHIWT